MSKVTTKWVPIIWLQFVITIQRNSIAPHPRRYSIRLLPIQQSQTESVGKNFGDNQGLKEVVEDGLSPKVQFCIVESGSP